MKEGEGKLNKTAALEESSGANMEAPENLSSFEKRAVERLGKGKMPKGVSIFKKGWIDELRSLKGEFPDEIRDILYKKQLSPQEHSLLQRYASEVFGWREVISESLKARKLEGWFGIMWENRQEFSQDMQILLKKFAIGGQMQVGESSYFNKEIDKWWRERFGISFAKRSVETEDDQGIKVKEQQNQKDTKTGKKIKKRIKKIQDIQAAKESRMNKLSQSLRALDDGENMEEFAADRRIIYFDEGAKNHFIIHNGQRQYLGVGDILSDYAWGIKYMPDPEMPHYYFRQLAKGILINEARRDIEDLYYRELGGDMTFRSTLIEEKLNDKKSKSTASGFLAEHMARELCNRAAINNDLGFLALRVDPIEDKKYKYDFKLKTVIRRRGVAIEYIKRLPKILKKIGVQFSVSVMRSSSKEKTRIVAEAKIQFAKQLPVDDIVVIVLSKKGPDFMAAFQKWFYEDKPSGGPEQFLSRDLKITLLKGATQELVNITDEELDKIFPPEPAELSDKKAVR